MNAWFSPGGARPVKQNGLYWLTPFVRICQWPEGAVLLDLKRNKYLGLDWSTLQAVASRVHNWPCPTFASAVVEELAVPASADAIRSLIEFDLLSDTPYAVPGPMTLPTPNTAIAGASIGLRTDHAVNFARACLWAKLAIKRPLHSVAASLLAIKAGAGDKGAFDEPVVSELVGTFRALRPFAFTANGKCLFHALALVRFLYCYDIFPSWVIGVRTKPWGAHSWVQHGGCVLDGTPEAVATFAPILVV